MLVSLLFSSLIFHSVNQEYHRFERLQEFIQERTGHSPMRRIVGPRIDPAIINAARQRLLTNLLVVNGGILAISTVLGYFLAGKTLHPIKTMVADLNIFVSDASHELRTPLTALRTEIEVGLRKPKLSLAESRRLLESNLEEVIRLQSLSDHLLKLSSPSVFVSDIVSLQTLVSNAIDKIQPLAKIKKIKIVDQTKAAMIKANSDTFQQLLVIILDNAIKYSPVGSTINLTSTSEGNRVKCVIADQGPGIAPAELPHIYNRFYRADKSRSQKGFGLGLSIAQKIIHAHHGSLHIESQVNQGTKVTLTLPLVKSTS